ncbi:MAG: hypothetical protein BGN96_17390 [Bacteroidales bacterium 45-6]|uniref:hypothetical protein n=1 Tax=uncultured Dysgonomonas sp. TaxID=206096 RepID=UPI00096809C0|nr:hypothetical protein [uncultured Dysgonomonas sp.]OJU53339.1 MAG: hypothetical protein BGN96_17390 [Bacteroidales bacterium 45-6]
MNPNYLILLNFITEEILTIRLNAEEIEESPKYRDFEDFLKTLEVKYDFKLSECQWITFETLSQRQIGF